MALQKTRQGRRLTPGRALQIYEEVDGPANRYHDYDGWELPEEANVQMAHEDATIYPPPEIAPQSFRIFARLPGSKKLNATSILQPPRKDKGGFTSF